MVRVRKEKGGPPQGASSIPEKKVKDKSNKKSSKNSTTNLEEQVLALGGSKADLELVKSVKCVKGGDAPVADPSLSKDVSEFLKTLNLGSSSADLASAAVTTKHKKATPKPVQSKKADSKDVESAPKSKAGPKKSAPNAVASTSSSAPEKATPKQAKPAKQTKQRKTVEPIAEPLAVEVAEAVESTPKVELPKQVTLDPKSRFIVTPASHWYSVVPTLPSDTASASATQMATLNTRAASLHETDLQTFQTSSSSNSSASEATFLSKIIQSGTLSDRLSALTLLVQSSPLHNVRALETLKGMAERGKGKGGRDESLKALRCVVDWWVGGGAPGRKLKYFRDQPLTHPSVTDAHLLAWYFEDWLKKYFFSILQILESLSLDPLPYVRTQSLSLISTLLREKPEQEQNLLRLLVNKLGDTEKALCSRASHHLLQLLQTHPSMKAVVVREVMALVLRPVGSSAAAAPASAAVNKHIRFDDDDEKPKPKPKPKQQEKKPAGNVHARYYATITLNQIVLGPGDKEVALKLIDVYFELFKELLGEGAIPENAEAEPEAKEEEDEKKADKHGRIRDHKKGKGKGKQTEIRGAAGFAEVEDENSKLVSAILTGVNRALPFAKMEAGESALSKHIDTLFLITHTSTFNISLQALVLIQQISTSLESSAGSSSSPNSIADRYYRTLYSSLHDPRLATSSKQAMYLNLLFKSIKADAPNTDRVKAIVRRFVQVLVSGGSGATEFVAGGLFLLGELFSSVPGLRSMLNGGNAAEESYDPKKRDPRYAHASASPLWELTPLLHHYHPAVSLHARQLLAGQHLTASADLSLNTTSHFLDRFVYKNPKQVKPSENSHMVGKGKGSSAMQPAASGLESGVKLMKGEMTGLEGRVNDETFLRRKESDVPVDQLFYYKFFTRKSAKDKGKTKTDQEDEDEDGDEAEVDDDDDDDDDEADSGEEMDLTGDEAKENGQDDEDDNDGDEMSELDEDEVWKAMKASMPKADGDEDLLDDSDVDIDDDEELDLSALNGDSDEMDDDSEAADSEAADSADADSDDADSDDALSLAEGSDNEDLISLDGEGGLIEYDGGSDDEEEWGGISGDANTKKRKRDEDASASKRKKKRSLPTFASYEDYAKMIEDGPEDYI